MKSSRELQSDGKDLATGVFFLDEVWVNMLLTHKS